MKQKQLEKFMKKYTKQQLAQTLVKTWHYNAFLRENLAMEILGTDFDIDLIDEDEVENLELFLDNEDVKKPLKTKSIADDVNFEINDPEII